MIAKFVYTMKNLYQNDSPILDKLIGLNGIITQPQIQYIIDNLGATFVSSIALVIAPNIIEATIQLLLSADFIASYPTPAERDAVLFGLFQGIISSGLSCVNVSEVITYV